MRSALLPPLPFATIRPDSVAFALVLFSVSCRLGALGSNLRPHAFEERGAIVPVGRDGSGRNDAKQEPGLIMRAEEYHYILVASLALGRRR